jgi:hypothetical protein
MNHHIVANGKSRFLRGKKAVTLASVEKDYVRQLAAADPVQKAQIHAQIMEDYFRRQSAENHKPSAFALW